MWLRLRQIALVAAELAPVERDLTEVLGIKVCYRDPGVAHFGLENALMPIGNQFLEVVAPGPAILAAAEARHAVSAPDQVSLCGMRINLR